MKPLECQLELLENTPWKLLLILDACRSDTFIEAAGDGRAVLSPANCTDKWIKATTPTLEKCGITRYYTANPLVGKHINGKMGEGTAIPLWFSLWSRLTDMDIPGVNPWAVNGWVLNDVIHENVEWPIVVHYLQPHFPAVGTPPFAIGQWGGKWTDLHMATRRLPRPERLHKKGLLDIDYMRESYNGNVRLAVRAAKHLVKMLNVDTIITSDHGELLGEVNEDGKTLFGHAVHEKSPILLSVPWMYCPRKEARSTDESRELREKLTVLGYY